MKLLYENRYLYTVQVELKQYGVRPLAKRKMVIKLKEIYHYTHKGMYIHNPEVVLTR